MGPSKHINGALVHCRPVEPACDVQGGALCPAQVWFVQPKPFDTGHWRVAVRPSADRVQRIFRRAGHEHKRMPRIAQSRNVLPRAVFRGRAETLSARKIRSEPTAAHYVNGIYTVDCGSAVTAAMVHERGSTFPSHRRLCRTMIIIILITGTVIYISLWLIVDAAQSHPLAADQGFSSEPSTEHVQKWRRHFQRGAKAGVGAK